MGEGKGRTRSGTCCRGISSLRSLMGMDIRFSCDNCGQHLVIDQAAAGLAVQCSACSTNLTVPKRLPASFTSSDAPTYQELYSQSRDLAYELRVDDAIRVWKQMEEARAQDRGHQLQEGFRFQGCKSVSVNCSPSIRPAPRGGGGAQPPPQGLTP